MASRKAKRENTKANTAICPICEKAVVDSGRKSQDSTFCEGSCQAWLHRCCTGLTRSRFDELSDNTLPFHCLNCVAEKQTQELADLKSVVAALVQDVEQLKSTVNTLKLSGSQPALAPQLSAQSQPAMTGKSWSQVVKKRKPKKSRQAQRDGESQYAEKLSSDRCSLEAGEQPLQRERVSGARRIWGTLRSTTVAAVTTALSRLTTVGDKLQVRRKYKTGKGRQSQSMVVHCERR